MPDIWDAAFAGEAATAVIATQARVRQLQNALLTLQVLFVLAALILITTGVVQSTSSSPSSSSSGSSGTTCTDDCSGSGNKTETGLIILGGLSAGMAATSASLAHAVRARDRAQGRLAAESGTMIRNEMQNTASNWFNKFNK